MFVTFIQQLLFDFKESQLRADRPFSEMKEKMIYNNSNGMHVANNYTRCSACEIYHKRCV